MKRMLIDEYTKECWKRYCLLEIASAPSPPEPFVPPVPPEKEVFRIVPDKEIEKFLLNVFQEDDPKESQEEVEKQETLGGRPEEQVEDPVSTKVAEEAKPFYSGKNGIIQLKPNVISIVDPKPRTIHQYTLRALKKPGTYFAQSKTKLLGPFWITPTPEVLPKGELVMIYECCSSTFSETSTTCFRPIGLFQN